MSRFGILRFILLAGAAGGCLPARSQSGLIDNNLAKRLGAGYAAMINFAENPDITTAHYYIDSGSGSDPILRAVRLRGEHHFHLKDRKWHLFVQIHAPYMTYQGTLDFGSDGSIEAEWKTMGAILMTGLALPVTTNLTINPALSAGYVRLENKASYQGDIAVLEPIARGVIFDWVSDATLVGAALGMDYERSYESFDLNLHAGASHNLIETYRTVNGSVEFSSYATTFTLNGEATHPTSFKPKGYPIALVGILGGTSFAGPNRDELGFAYFVDAGLALEANIERNGWVVKKLRLGLKGIYGEDVIGWSAIFSWKF